MAHVKLALKGMQNGVDHIPDKVFENIPYIGPRYFRESDEKQNRRNRRRANSSSSDSSSDSEAEKGARSSRRRNEDRDQDSRRARSHDDRRSERSRGGPPGGYDANPYFPPPPVDPAARANSFVPGPYDPREYGANPGSRDDYYHDHPQERQPYVPPPPIPPQHSVGSPAPQSTTGSSFSAYNDGRSSVADRYRPAKYEPSQAQLVPRSRSAYDGGYDSEMGTRRGSQGDYLHPQHQTYYPPSFDGRGYDDYYDSRSRNGSRQRDSRDSYAHDGAERSESSRRSGGDRFKEEFNKHKKDIGASALGAVAGGIIGNQFAKKNSKVGILVGAAIGGIGGGLIERQRENRKERKQLEHRWSSGRLKDGNDGF